MPDGRRFSARSGSRWHSVRPLLLPAAALMGLVLPITFLQPLESWLHYMRPLELLAVYGTSFLLFLPVALALTALTAALHAMLSRTRAGALGRLREVGVPLLGFGLVLAFGLNLGVATWLAHLQPGGTAGTDAPRYRWVLLAALLALVWSPALRRVVSSWVTPALGLAGLGALTLLAVPLIRWDTAAVERGPAKPGQPNIVLITFDALTASRMSLYGFARPTTPNLERYARDAAVFERFYANGNYTTPGINAIASGTLPWTHRALQLASWPTLQARDASLFAQLRRAGYRTLAVSTNPLAGPYKNGYGAQFDAVASDRIATYFSGRDGPSRWLRYLGPALDNPLVTALLRPIGLAQWAFASEQSANRHYDPALVFEAAKALVGDDRSAPVFLWIHLLPPHSPYAAPVPFLGRFDDGPHFRSQADSTPPFLFDYAKVDAVRRRAYEARYDESVLYLDDQLAGFLAWSERALGPRSLTLVSADHGESFDPAYGGHAGPLLSDEVLRIPLVVKGEGVVPGRLRSVASQVDLAPTLAEIAGAALAPQWVGRSLAPLLRSGHDEGGREAWSMNFEQSRRSGPLDRGSIALITDEWKYVHYVGTLRYPGAPAFEDRLFRADEDTAERHDLRAAQPVESRALRARIEAALARHSNLPP